MIFSSPLLNVHFQRYEILKTSHVLLEKVPDGGAESTSLSDKGWKFNILSTPDRTFIFVPLQIALPKAGKKVYSVFEYIRM